LCEGEDENWSFQTQLNRTERFGHWMEKETLAAGGDRRRQAPSGYR